MLTTRIATSTRNNGALIQSDRLRVALAEVTHGAISVVVKSGLTCVARPRLDVLPAPGPTRAELSDRRGEVGAKAEFADALRRHSEHLGDL
jgi:hypothetical protein